MDTVNRFFSIGRNLLERGDLHDIGFIENQIGTGMKSTLIYGAYPALGKYWHKEASPRVKENANALASLKTLTDVIFETSAANSRYFRYGAELIIHVVPKIGWGSTGLVEAEGEMESSWRCPCPSVEAMSPLLRAGDVTENATPGFSLPEGPPGVSPINIHRVIVTLHSPDYLSMKLELTDVSPLGTAAKPFSNQCSIRLEFAQVISRSQLNEVRERK